MKQIFALLALTFLSCCVFTFSVLSNNHTLGDVGLFEWLTDALLLYILYTLAIIIFYSLTSLMKACFWFGAGYRRVTIVAYPLLIIREETFSVRFFLNPLRLGEDIYPSDFIERMDEEHNGSKASAMLIRYEIWKLLVQFMLLLLTGVFLAGLGFVYLLPSIIAAFVPLIFFNCLNTEIYHASFVKIKNLKDGYFGYYLAENLIAGSTRLSIPYRWVEESMFMDKSGNVGFGYMRMRIMGHLFMLKTSETDSVYELLPETEAFIEKVFAEADTLSLGSAQGSETWDFMKIYMCYALLRDDKSALERVLAAMERLRHGRGFLSTEEETVASDYIVKIINWYIDIGRYRRLDESKDYELIRRDRFLYLFPLYRQIYDSIVQRSTRICSPHLPQ